MEEVLVSCEFHSMEEDNLGEEANRVFGQIWKSPAPSKVIALSWKGLLDRIPTRTNLARRNVLEPSASLLCALCNDVDESTNHLFLHCTKTWKVWSEIKNWLELNFITPFNLFDHWECWDGYATNSKELKRGLRLIWQAVVWVIWSVRNNVIFNNGVVEVDYMVEEKAFLDMEFNKDEDSTMFVLRMALESKVVPRTVTRQLGVFQWWRCVSAAVRCSPSSSKKI